ncbi:MAG: SDR family NAD(P)-dependent oxidoreductase [Aggregatilineales bacterium]
MKWTEQNIPDQRGRVAIVTGANSGIGWDTARALAQKGATVIMACRNLAKATPAADEIKALKPKGAVVVMQLDLSDLESVHAFAEAFQAQYDRLDLLINNAGVMVPPYGKTKQGFEQQFGVNHLAHFVLTALLIDLLNATPNARVVTVSSGAHRFGTIKFDDLQSEKSYQPERVYGQSKLANLLFTYELQRRLEKSGQGTIAVAAHPGWTSTNLQQHSTLIRVMNPIFAQDGPMGALPTLYAATATDVQGGDYYGPGGLFEMRGYPKKVGSSDRSRDEAVAERLWSVSEDLTQVKFDLAGVRV